MSGRSTPANRLRTETSPYLLQHAGNPVDWYPWGEEALQRARSEHRPILLSIGYSACHWCHVMAHESFEDEDTARLMNEHFVNIKVDREERPDLDRIYQTAHQLLTQRPGGWPLTMFLEPEHLTPFFGGTYFPPEPRHGMPAFSDLLERISNFYTGHGDDVARQTRAVREVFERIDGGAPPGAARLDAAPLEAARRRLEQLYDERFGGFGAAPKFPHPASIERLLRHYEAGGGVDERALDMALTTLTRMAEGGLYDQLGGGFSRYSVDPYWMIPHFEKMLYDNGSLLALYADAAAISPDPLYARIAGETADWVLREMRDPGGGFYSSLDADSGGEEGKYYVWQREEVAALLDAGEFALLEPLFGLDREPNFEGHWHLHTFERLDSLAAHLGVSPEVAADRLRSARAKLFARRSQRPSPARDEKILTSWNALVVRGLAISARRLRREDLGDAADAAVDFVRRELYRNGRLLATSRDGRAHLGAYLDDYAYTIDALLELLQLRWRGADLEFAVALADSLLEHFEDPEHGGFYFTADDHESLLQRPRTFTDDAIPSGNGIAARALARLGHLLGESRYLQAAENTLRASWAALARYPDAHATMLDALEAWLKPGEIVVIRTAEALDARWRAVLEGYAPRRTTLVVPSGAVELPPALAARVARGETCAYVCRGSECSAPIDDPAALVRAFAQQPGRAPSQPQ